MALINYLIIEKTNSDINSSYRKVSEKSNERIPRKILKKSKSNKAIKFPFTGFLS